MAVIAVLGAGGWGTALAVMANREGHTVRLWSPFQEELSAIRRDGEHKKLLPGVPVPPTIELTTDIRCVTDAALTLLVVPSFAIAETAEKLKPVLPAGALVANAGKGIETDTHRRFTEVLQEALPTARIVALSGPSHAEEVGRGVPTSLVSASTDVAAAEEVQDLLICPQFRIYTSTDVIGVELGGALKNVIALAAGICDGLRMGDNTKAALMTRGLSEIARLGVALGARQETFAGLSGMGDLMVTCGSMHSRNRRAGILIGEGVSAKEAIRRIGTVEGYLAAETAYALSRETGVEMPITEQCYRICYEGLSPRAALEALLTREKKYEWDQPWLGDPVGDPE